MKSIFSSFQALHSIAKCVSALTVACPGQGNSVVNQFVKDIKVQFSTDILYCVSVPAAPGQPLIQTFFLTERIQRAQILFVCFLFWHLAKLADMCKCN